MYTEAFLTVTHSYGKVSCSLFDTRQHYSTKYNIKQSITKLLQQYFNTVLQSSQCIVDTQHLVLQ